MFSKSDLQIFEVEGFKERMPLIKEKIRPKLEAFGNEVAPLLQKKFKKDFFPHTAKHMRRTVNPPDETWVALGPEKRGYKAYIFFSLCIGKKGVQARVVIKDESKMRPDFGTNLKSNSKKIESSLKKEKLKNFTKRNASYEAESVGDFSIYLSEASERLKNLKSAVFDLGLELNPQSKTLAEDFVEACAKLYPIYVCGLQKGVKLS